MNQKYLILVVVTLFQYLTTIIARCNVQNQASPKLKLHVQPQENMVLNFKVEKIHPVADLIKPIKNNIYPNIRVQTYNLNQSNPFFEYFKIEVYYNETSFDKISTSVKDDQEVTIIFSDDQFRLYDSFRRSEYDKFVQQPLNFRQIFNQEYQISQIYNVSVVPDINPPQYFCLLNMRCNYILGDDYEEFVNFDRKCVKKECIKQSSSMYDLEIEGQGKFYEIEDYIQMNFTTKNNFVSQCLEGDIQLKGDNNTSKQITNSGRIYNPSFNITKELLRDYCNNHVCKIEYTLQIPDIFKVIFDVTLNLVNKNQSFQYEINKDVPFEKLATLNGEHGIILHKNYSMNIETTLFGIQKPSQLVLYTSQLFKHKLENRNYAAGSAIFAQIQVEVGYKAEEYQMNFLNAELDGKTLQVMKKELDQQGNLNLILVPRSFQSGKIADLHIQYEVQSKYNPTEVKQYSKQDTLKFNSDKFLAQQ